MPAIAELPTPNSAWNYQREQPEVTGNFVGYALKLPILVSFPTSSHFAFAIGFAFCFATQHCDRHLGTR
jgi:hypothetical protein